jgi:hypothetical protein
MAVIPSPLSNSIQGINQSTVSGSIFGGNKVDPETQSSINANTSAVASMQKQVNELSQTNAQILTNLTQIGSFQAQVDSVRLQLNGISDTLQSVATITASEGAIERQKDLYEQEKQKRLAETGARGGQESLLETKIQSALSEPVKRIGSKISFGFDNLMSSIWTLLGGWLTTQIIKGLKALQDDDKKKLNEIKDSVIKTLLVAGGVFTIINVGIVKVISTITGLVAKIGKFVIGGLIIKPFQTVMSGLGNAASGIFRGNKPPTPPSPRNTGPKPAGGGLLSVIGKVITGASVAMNFVNGENVDAVLETLTISPIGGKFGTGLKVAAGTVVALDHIAEFLGGNLTGADPKVLKEKREELKKAQEAGKNQNKLTSSPLKKDEPPKPATAKPAPKTSMTPPASNLQINAPKVPKEDKTATASAPAGTTPTPATTPEPAGTTSTPASVSPAASATTSAPTPEPAPSAAAKPEPVQVSAESPKEQPKVSMEAKPAETSSKPSTPDITPAQTTKMQTVPFNIGPEPEPKPNVVYAPSGSSAPQQQQPSSTGAASDVPFIPSSNTDNFYTLYSQINYNVVL